MQGVNPLRRDRAMREPARAERRTPHECLHGQPGDQVSGFITMVEGEIIPRLLMAHRSDSIETRAPARSAPPEIRFDVEKFTRLALAEEAHMVLAEIDVLLAMGVSAETICIDLLAPVARRLGWLWEEDRCDFIAVTMGLWRLQEVVHALSARSPSPCAAAADNRSALFTVPPGDQHSFGSIIVEESFRRAGWTTWNAPTATADELADLVGRRWFDVIGLTITCDQHIDELPPLISALRATSRNPDVQVMVGGRAFSERPGMAAEIGADGTAADARVAVLEAEKLLDLVSTRTASLVAGRA